MNSKAYIGIIGFGSMGQMIAEGLLRTESISESQLKICTRTKKRVHQFKKENPEIVLCDSLDAVVLQSTVLILCIPPNESIGVLKELSKLITSSQLIISIVGSLTLKLIERFISTKIIRMVPSITSEVDEGMFIISENRYCTQSDINKVYRLFSRFGEVLEVPENKIEVFTNLTSCSPGILSAIFQEYITSAVKIGKVSKKQATTALIKTLYGLSKLYYEEEKDFDTIISRVARKGGTTETGIKIVQNDIPQCFDKVFIETLEHQKRRKKLLEKSICQNIAST